MKENHIISKREFEELIEPLVSRRDNDMARQAWDIIQNLSLDNRKHLFSQCCEDITELVAQFFYLYGSWFPEETFDALVPLTQKRYAIAWQILASLISREQVYINGKLSHPFVPIQGGDQIELRPIVIDSVCHLLHEEIQRIPLQDCLLVIDAIAQESSLAVIRVFIDLIIDPQCDNDLRLLISVYIKILAEKIANQGQTVDWEPEAHQLARIVGDNSEDPNVRLELSEVFLHFRIAEGADAVRTLIEETQRTGFGAAYLPQLEVLLYKLEEPTQSAYSDGS